MITEKTREELLAAVYQARYDAVEQAIDAARKDGHKAVLMRVKSAEGVRYVALGLTAAG